MRNRWVRIAAVVCVALVDGLAAAAAWAYPLDLYEQTGMMRLKAYYLASEGPMKGRFLYPGALLPGARVRLRLADRPGFAIPQADRALTAEVVGLLGRDAADYSLVVLDLTDPARPVLASHNAERVLSPGSVGKVLVLLAWFQALADIYPTDTAARQRVLREAMITANDLIVADDHEVPMWREGDRKVTVRPLVQGDTANAWSYLDWMSSASSNAAASMAMAHLILLRQTRADYVSMSQHLDDLLNSTPKPELQRMLVTAMESPVRRNGLNPAKLRQGSLFTRRGKERIPAAGSHTTARALLEFAVRMEQGKLVDPFSSLEIKRLLYLTDERIRYASSPALESSAVYYKSGSLYACKPEPGFACGEYEGNVKNFLNSLAIVETFDRKPELHYIAVVLSNVLRRNSALEHQTLATGIHRLIEARHPAQTPPAPPAATKPNESKGVEEKASESPERDASQPSRRSSDRTRR
jgi:hypothetical protein